MTMHRSSGPRYGLILPNPVVGADAAKMVDYAVAAEESGWDGVFLWDVLVNPPPPDDLGQAGDPEPWNPDHFEDLIDPVITLAGIATRTDRITLGTWIIPIARRQPWQVARDFATLDRLSNGRVVLGVGLGRRPEFDKFGTPWDSKVIGEKYDEALELIDRFWSGERVTFHGKHFTVDDVALLPTPVQKPRIPILVAGFWPNKKPFRRGARWDGIMPVVNPHPDSKDLREMVAYYGEVADQPGDVFLLVDPSALDSATLDLYRELGITWLAMDVFQQGDGHEARIDRIRQGPPGS
jgi:alkanesulfonate monooxygenase SsuD/methylene tetrahydromethanopterin reductase-like flavin-dependent oxidoreductase (luciferase family)